MNTASSIKNKLHSQPSQDVQTLRYCSAAQLQRLSSLLKTVFQEWEREWMLSSAGVGGVVVCRDGDATGVAGDGWYALHAMQHGANQNEPCCWLKLQARNGSESNHGNAINPVTALRELLFGKDGHNKTLPSSTPDIGRMTGEAASIAWDELVGSLRAALVLGDAPASLRSEFVSANDSRVWSGAASVQVQWQEMSLCLYLNAACVEKTAPVTPRENILHLAAEVVSLNTALEKRKLSLNAVMTPVEISLGDLQSLRINDVVLLEHRLDDPLILRLQDGPEIGTGFLGKARGHWAIEMNDRDRERAPD